jgi:hypothetical protein
MSSKEEKQGCDKLQEISNVNESLKELSQMINQIKINPKRQSSIDHETKTLFKAKSKPGYSNKTSSRLKNARNS